MLSIYQLERKSNMDTEIVTISEFKATCLGLLKKVRQTGENGRAHCGHAQGSASGTGCSPAATKA